MSKNSAIILVFSYFATITLHDYDVYSWGLNFLDINIYLYEQRNYRYQLSSVNQRGSH